MANVFYSTFLNVFYSCHFFTFLTFFFIFPGTFFTSNCIVGYFFKTLLCVYTFWFFLFYIIAYTTLNKLLAVFLYIMSFKTFKTNFWFLWRPIFWQSRQRSPTRVSSHQCQTSQLPLDFCGHWNSVQSNNLMSNPAENVKFVDVINVEKIIINVNKRVS